ncbi:MAG: hypothetical protein WDM71_08965 [Ferruginibacter sp.]
MTKTFFFTELEVWKEIVSMRREFFSHKEHFLANSRSMFFRKLQLLLLTATNTIADGFGRLNYAENIQQMIKSRSALCRFVDAIIFLKEENIIESTLSDLFESKGKNCIILLDDYIKEELIFKRKIKLS